MTAGSLRTFASVGRLHIVAIAALGTFTFGWLFTGRYPWMLAGICAFDWFVVNLLNRVVDLPEDRDNQIVGVDFVARNRRTLVVLGFSILLSSLVLTTLWLPALTPLRLGYHALGLAYNWPLLPGRRRIKQLYFWKNTASAVGFLLTVFAYPLAAAGWGRAGLPAGVTPSTILWSAAFFFPFELSYEVLYDLRDAPGDRAAGVRTYPVVHGEARAVRIVEGLLAASMAILIAGWALGALPWRVFIMICAPALQWLLGKWFVRRGITARDCIALTWLGAALLVTYHLWIVAGLPGTGL